MDYKRFDILGNFLRHRSEPEPIVDDRVGQFERRIDYDIIAKTNNEHETIPCNQKILEYQELHPEDKEIFRLTLLLRKYLDGRGEFQTKRPKIVARGCTVSSILLLLLNIPGGASSKITFRKEGSTIFLEAQWFDMKNNDKANVFRISKESILKGNPFQKEERSMFDFGGFFQAIKEAMLGKEEKEAEIHVLGETSHYRVVRHNFENFDLIVSKEIGAEIDDPVEIIPVKNDGQLNVRKLLLKSVFLGATKKAVLNVIEDDKIIRICSMDDLSRLDCKNDLPLFKQTCSDFFNWLVRYAESVDDFEGELAQCIQGIMVRSGDSFALFDRSKPTHLKVYSRHSRPMIHLCTSVRLPRLDGRLCDVSRSQRITADPSIRPVIVVADSPVVYKCQPLLKRPDFIVVICKGDFNRIENNLQRFLTKIHPDIVEVYPPKKPVLLVSPAYFQIPNFPLKDNYDMKRLCPWTCNLNEENYIVAHYEMADLADAVSLHRWIGDPQFVRLTVICIGPLKFDEAIVRDVLRSQFCENTVTSARVITDVVGNDQVYVPFLCDFFGIPESSFPLKQLNEPKKHSSGKKLHLIGDSTINMSKDRCILGNGYIQRPFDLQLISNFLENGLLPYRLIPRKLFVTGTEQEIAKVHEKLAEYDFHFRVFEQVI